MYKVTYDKNGLITISFVNSSHSSGPDSITNNGLSGGQEPGTVSLGEGQAFTMAELISASVAAKYMRSEATRSLAEEYNQIANRLNADPSNQGIVAELSLQSAAIRIWVSTFNAPEDGLIVDLQARRAQKMLQEVSELARDADLTPLEEANLIVQLQNYASSLGMPFDYQAFDSAVNNLKTLEMDKLIRNTDNPHCFPAHTAILTSLTTSTAISALRAGDTVLSFDPRADHGRGALTPRRIRRLFRNTTTEWIVLSWGEAGEARTLTLTPGHHVLDPYGQFPTIEAMLRDGVATVVLASGALAQVRAERIIYSAATAHLYERAQNVGVMAGNAALQPVLMDAWQTYNFEVEDLHTYVAGGVRVHNDSGLLGWIGNQTNEAIDSALDIKQGSVGDIATDILTAPLHIAGEVLDLGVKAIDALARGGLWLADQLGVGITDPNWTQIVGPGPVAHSNEIAHATGPHTSVYDKDSPFAGQPVQAGGDADHDGQLEPGDKFLHDAGLYDRAAAEARANGNPLQAQYYEGRAERARAQAAALQFPDNGSDDDDDGSPLAPDTSIRPQPNPRHTNTSPVLLDLDGNGIKVTDLARSTVFMDAGDDGLEHRTAWAGQGDGVLFIDADGDGKISQTREYVFTEWDPTARSDFEALRARFDSNNDGKLTAADARFGEFRVMVTNPDGTQTVKTLAEAGGPGQAGITSIDLTGDTTHIRLPDGSVITGQSTFTIGGVERTAADVTLMAEAQGYDVRTSAVVAGSVRTTTQTAIDSDGDIAFRIVSVALADGSVTVNSYDDNGDGQFDRTQRITVEVAGNTRTETTVNKLGSEFATGVLADRTVETTRLVIFTVNEQFGDCGQHVIFGYQPTLNSKSLPHAA